MDGYTVCPLITDIGKVMLAEFNWSAKPAPSFHWDPTQERWIWWLLKVYMLKPMTQYGMLRVELKIELKKGFKNEKIIECTIVFKYVCIFKCK